MRSRIWPIVLGLLLSAGSLLLPPAVGGKGPAWEDEENDGLRSPTGLNVDYGGTFGLHDPPYNLSGVSVVVGLWEQTHASQGHPDLYPRVTLGDATSPTYESRSLVHSEMPSGSAGVFEIGETLYQDNDDDRKVSQGDERLSEWTDGTQVLAPGQVGPSDADAVPGTLLGNWPVSSVFCCAVGFVDNLPRNFHYSAGEGAYQDVDTNSQVSIGDVRLIAAPGFGLPGPVAAADPDVTNPPLVLSSFPSTLLHPPHFHSTQMAGTILGSGVQSASLGGTPFQWKGVAPGATLRSYIHDRPVADMTADYVNAANNGVTLSNNSWGWDYCNNKLTPATCYDDTSEFYDSVASGRDRSGGFPSSVSRRILILGSAGNEQHPERYVDSNGNGRYDDTEAIYEDDDDSGDFSPGDDHLKGQAPPAGPPPPLVNFALNEMHDETAGRPGHYFSTEGIYLDADGSRTVSAGDTRITPPAGILLPGPVLSTDSDVDQPGTPNPLKPFQLWGTIRVPNGAKNTLQIANITSDTKMLSWQTGRGPTDDGRLKPDLAAPGDQEIELPLPAPFASSLDGGIISTHPPDIYFNGEGTSPATAAATGAAALLTEWYRTSCAPDPPPEVYRALLIHGAEDLTSIRNVPGTFAGPDYGNGYGRLRAKESVDLVAHHRRGTVNASFDKVDYPITIGRTGSLKVTLVWDDPPHPFDVSYQPFASILQNDLDLGLIAPNGTKYTPWELDPTNPFAPAVRSSFPGGTPISPASQDRWNTVEQVVVDNAMPGVWTIRVYAANIRMSPQTFAVVSEMLPPEGGCTNVPATDVWMKDGAADTGATPYAGPIESPDIVNRNAPDGQFVDQAVIFGQTNYLYVNVRNSNPVVTARPVSIDVWGTTRAAPLWPTNFRYLGRFNTPMVTNNIVWVLGPLAWDPPAVAPANAIRLYVRVQSGQDPIGAIETANTGSNIRSSNNITGRVLRE